MVKSRRISRNRRSIRGGRPGKVSAKPKKIKNPFYLECRLSHDEFTNTIESNPKCKSLIEKEIQIFLDKLEKTNLVDRSGTKIKYNFKVKSVVYDYSDPDYIVVKCSLEKPLDGKSYIAKNALESLKEIIDNTFREHFNSVNCNGTELRINRFSITNDEQIEYRRTFIRNGRQTWTAYGSLDYR